MTTIDRTDLATEVADISEELAELQERFERVMQQVRRLPGGDWLYARVDAYPGIRLDRDMGAGQGPIEWLAEVAAFLEDGEPEDEPPVRRAPHAPYMRSHGHDPRGPGAG